MIEPIILKSRGKDMLCLLEYRDAAVRGKELVIYKHGFCGNKTTPHRMLVNLVHDLQKDGYTMLRFDCLGAGDSEGDWSYMTIPGEAEDLKAVLRWAAEEIKPEKVMLLGYSMGGLVSALCCHEIPLEGILLWSPCGDSYQCFKHLLGEERFEAGLRGEDIDFAGDRVGKEFFTALGREDLDPIKSINGYDKPVFIIHGTADTDVPPDNSKRYLEVIPGALRHLVKGAGHGYDSWDVQDELFRYSKEYIERIMRPKISVMTE